MSQKNIKQQLDIWAEGDIVDLWTLVHFLAGVLLGYAPFLVPASFNTIFITVVAVLVLWEVFEYVRDIHETLANRLVDILIALAGFALVVFLYPLVPERLALVAGGLLLGVYILLNLAGWQAYRSRN